MKEALKFIWDHRTATMSVAQLAVANLATAEIVTGTALKWVLYVNGVITGLIALHNTLKARKEKTDATA